jgi:hypothetical protein
LSNGIFGKHKYISDRAELVVDSLKRTTPFMLKRELRYLSVVMGQEEVTASSCFFINKGKGIYRGFLMNLENIKESTKDGIIQSFMENAKFARRGASHQRPKSWSKGTKSGSSKRKTREEGKREAKEMQEGVSPFKKWELYHELKHEDSPNFQRNMRQDREIARIDANSKWAMERLMPVYEKHGMAEEHAGTTDEYGFPQYAHAVTHPNFKGFVADFIAFHTAENKRHWAEKGKASSYHWPAILRARRALQTHEELAKKNPGDLSESFYTRLRKRLAESSPVIGWYEGDPEVEGDEIAGIEATLPKSKSSQNLESVHKDFLENLEATHAEDPGSAAQLFAQHLAGYDPHKDPHHIKHLISAYKDITQRAQNIKDIPF